MPYWVYGNDEVTGEPAEPFYSNADSGDAASVEAASQGIVVERVEEEALELPQDRWQAGRPKWPVQVSDLRCDEPGVIVSLQQGLKLGLCCIDVTQPRNSH